MMLTTISSNPISIVIIGSLFLRTLVRSSFSSYPHTIPLLLVCTTTEQLAASPTISLCAPSSLLHTQQTNLSRFHHIRQAPSFSRHHPNIQTAHYHAVTVLIPHKNDIYGDYIFSASKRKENDFHLFTGSIMDPFKTGQPDCLLRPKFHWANLEGFHLMWYQNRPQLKTGQFPLTQRVSSQ